AYLAELFVNAGAHSVIADFNNIDAVGGDLLAMAKQVRSAVAWVYQNAQKFGGDPSRLYVSGHSSGGHLAGCIATCDWRRDFGLPRDIRKGALVASGMYDLKPVRLSKRSKYVNFTDESEQELSAQRHIDRLNCPIVVAHGTLETPEFQRQARDFAAAVKAAGKPVKFLVGESYNHFEMLETLATPYGLLARAQLALMQPGGDEPWRKCRPPAGRASRIRERGSSRSSNRSRCCAAPSSSRRARPATTTSISSPRPSIRKALRSSPR